MRKSFFIAIAFSFIVSISYSFAQFSSSNLPIIVINTNGSTIVDDPKVEVQFKVFYHADGSTNYLTDSVLHFDGKAGIELRGSSTQIFPKKSYSIELINAENGEDLAFPLLGFSSESDWALVANYDDNTHLKNAYVYDLWSKTGNYSPRTKHVEVILNNEYMGLYVFTEKIKRDAKRIDIKKLETPDSTAEKITGGYIIEGSRESEVKSAPYIWQSVYPSSPTSAYHMYMECTYPKEPTDKQFNYIKTYLNDFESALKSNDFKDATIGFRKYIDENSFAENFVIQEYSLHFDIFARSQFFYKDRGKKLIASPVWDVSTGLFDNYATSWRFSCSNCDPRFFWLERMMQDCDFKAKVIDTYRDFRRTFLTYEKGTQYIDSVANSILDAALRDRAKWHPSASGSFTQDIQKLKNFIAIRLNWIDSNIHNIKNSGKNLSSSTYHTQVNQVITLTSNCSSTSPVIWSYDNADGTYGDFSGSKIETVLITQPVTYTAKCQTPCPEYTNTIKITVDNQCPDTIHLQTFIVNPDMQHFKSKYIIISSTQTAPNISTTYSSGNAIILNSGFASPQNGVFLAQIKTCDEP